MRHCLQLVGPPPFDAADQTLARCLQKALGKPETGVRTTAEMAEPAGLSNASSDVAEVCAVVPLAHLRVVCLPDGLSLHHWNVTACAGSPLGRKGMLTAAKVLALTGMELIRRPELVAKAKAEHRQHTGGRPYRPPVPDAVLDAQLPKPPSPIHP
jgi:aminobenzoyl-glutamate utilization protein B